MTQSAIVICNYCNIPGRVIFSDNGSIEKVLFVCTCPRPIEEVKADPDIDEVNNGGRTSETST